MQKGGVCVCWGGCYSSPREPETKHLGGAQSIGTSTSRWEGEAGSWAGQEVKDPLPSLQGAPPLTQTSGFFQADFPRGRTEHLPQLLQEQPPSPTKMEANSEKALKLGWPADLPAGPGGRPGDGLWSCGTGSARCAGTAER